MTTILRYSERGDGLFDARASPGDRLESRLSAGQLAARIQSGEFAKVVGFGLGFLQPLSATPRVLLAALSARATTGGRHQ